ncbi:MAG: hypothetical protein IKG46_04180 [Solobacterium sp.]|nr:hypothetical protein [Solobacterium sp.]
MNTDKLQSTIYIGLNDKDTGVQKFDTEKYLSILKSVCRSYGTAFSIHILNGGYFHEDGRYVEETTLALMLMGAEESLVTEIARDLCVFFHQESVMVTKSPCSAVFISGDIE